MLTLEETLASQKDLAELCKDRPIESSEIFPGNAYYGIGRILKSYARLPPGYALKAVIPHGLTFQGNHVWEAERTAILSTVLAYPAYRATDFKRLTSKSVHLSASPFLYLHEMLKGGHQPQRKGTIFFPLHSTRHLVARMDWEMLAEELTHLDDEFQPVTICIYWKDLLLDHHVPFKRRGLRIVSAGHMFDPLFLYRFYHLCRLHRYSASNHIGSHLFYSMKAGCSFFLFEPVPYFIEASEDVLRREGIRSGSPSANRTYPPRTRALRELFGTPQQQATPQQLEVVDEYLGGRHLRSRVGLLRQLLAAELLDKTQFRFYRNGGPTFQLPPFARRRQDDIRRRLQRVKRAWSSSV